MDVIPSQAWYVMLGGALAFAFQALVELFKASLAKRRAQNYFLELVKIHATDAQITLERVQLQVRELKQRGAVTLAPTPRLIVHDDLVSARERIATFDPRNVRKAVVYLEIARGISAQVEQFDILACQEALEREGKLAAYLTAERVEKLIDRLPQVRGLSLKSLPDDIPKI